VGHTSVLAVTALMVPIMVLLAFIIPGAVNVPLADLPALLFLWVFVAAPNRGDMLRTLITAISMGIIGTFLSILVAPWLAMVAANSGIAQTDAQATSAFLHLNPDQLLGGLFANSYSSIGVLGFVVVVGIVLAITAFIRIRYNMQQSKVVAAAAGTD
jgi:PTS system galactitol-specific IIC component